MSEEQSIGKTPWWQRGIIYQIYVRSFSDSNGDGIGDLPGITARLDYLNNGTSESLGVDAIWLTPFYQSPDRDFGYDVSDYRKVHPQHGTMGDFDRLLDEAHRRGIRVIIDFVPNHTSDEHPWFVESSESLDSAKRDWYIWAGGKGSGPPNNWQAAPGGGAWKLDKRTNQYFYHAFFDFQPDLNWRNRDVRDAVYDDIRFWLDKGVDGLRLDLINYLVEDEQLRDNRFNMAGWYFGRFQDSVHTRDLKETHDILAEFRVLMDGYEERMMVGEVVSFPWEDSTAAEYTGSRELHLAFNMEFLAVTRFRGESFRNIVNRFERRLADDGWPAYVLSNHDMPRHLGRLAGWAIYGHRRHAMAKGKVCAAMLLTLRGTPFLYYGEELGMTNRWWPKNRVQDPMGRKAWPIYQGRDASRTPMLWSTGEGAGFTTGRPWLDIDRSADRLCVEVADRDPASLLNFYRKLAWLRKRTPALQVGTYEPLDDCGPSLFAYRRRTEAQSIIVALNFSGRVMEMPEGIDARVLLSTEERGKSVKGRPRLDPYEVLICEE